MFAGLDLSLTGSGITIIDDSGDIVFGEKLHVPQVGVERLYFLHEKFVSILNNYSIAFSCIESAAYHETGRLFDIGCWAGVVMLEVFNRGIPLISATPLQLKKYVSGEGKNKGKAVVILDIYKMYGKELRDDNVADAFVLANIARDYHAMFIKRDPLPVKAFQSEVLKKINKSESVQKNLII